MQTPILLVEDDPNDEELILRALKKLDVQATVARDGRQALDLLLNAGEQPRLILLDLKLPMMGGLEVLQALRVDNRTRLTPVVVFTSSTEKTDVRTSYDLGANSYVSKPVDFKAFSDTLQQLVRYWLHLNVEIPRD